VSTEDEPLPAGSFSTWLAEIQLALRDERASDVPCDGCTACCTSSQFIHIGPDEADTLARIPVELQFPAPGLPRGHIVLGYDENGHCPMLVDGACSIYDDRPRTCRTYDCRIFPAAGVEVVDEHQVAIGRRSRRWQFDLATDADQIQHDAVRSAATWVGEHGALLPEGVAPSNATQHAVLAIELHEAFLHEGMSGA
jgi:Fe-S-cluster containining protein